MPGAIECRKQYTSLKAFQNDEEAMHLVGWATAGIEEREVARNCWQRVMRRHSKTFDVRYVRPEWPV